MSWMSWSSRLRERPCLRLPFFILPSSFFALAALLPPRGCSPLGDLPPAGRAVAFGPCSPAGCRRPLGSTLFPRAF